MLIAATGLAGAGKTTALQFLSSIGIGEYYYVGGIVGAEVKARGFSATPDSERLVREALRSENGMAALANLAAPQLQRRLNEGHTILIDAICNVEESIFYRDNFGGDLIVLAIVTPFDTRAERLAIRPHRPMTAEQLRERDSYEIESLQLQQVTESADLLIHNVDGIARFQHRLRSLARDRLRRN